MVWGFNGTLELTREEIWKKFKCDELNLVGKRGAFIGQEMDFEILFLIFGLFVFSFCLISDNRSRLLLLASFSLSTFSEAIFCYPFSIYTYNPSSFKYWIVERIPLVSVFVMTSIVVLPVILVGRIKQMANPAKGCLSATIGCFFIFSWDKFLANQNIGCWSFEFHAFVRAMSRRLPELFSHKYDGVPYYAIYTHCGMVMLFSCLFESWVNSKIKPQSSNIRLISLGILSIFLGPFMTFAWNFLMLWHYFLLSHVIIICVLALLMLAIWYIEIISEEYDNEPISWKTNIACIFLFIIWFISVIDSMFNYQERNYYIMCGQIFQIGLILYVGNSIATSKKKSE